MYLHRYFLLILVVISMTACMSKVSYLSDFDKFITKTTEKAPSYSAKDWSIADSIFLDFAKVKYNKYSDKLNEKEKAKVLELSGKYVAIRVKGGVNTFIESIKGLGTAADSFMKELKLDTISSNRFFITLSG